MNFSYFVDFFDAWNWISPKADFSRGRLYLYCADSGYMTCNLPDFIDAYSGPNDNQENQRKKAAELKATAPIASKTRQARNCLSLPQPEFEFT